MAKDNSDLTPQERYAWFADIESRSPQGRDAWVGIQRTVRPMYPINNEDDVYEEPPKTRLKNYRGRRSFMAEYTNNVRSYYDNEMWKRMREVKPGYRGY